MKRKVLLITVLLFLTSCSQSDNDITPKEVVSENIDTTLVNGALSKNESEDQINNLKITNKKKHDKKQKKTKSGLDDSGSIPDRLRIDSGSALVNACKKQKVVQNDSGSALVNGSKKQKVVQNDSQNGSNN